MIFVETSFLLAVLNPRDALHSRAQARAGTITESLLIAEYVVWELVNGLSMPVDRPKAYSAVQEIQTALEWEWISASPSLFEAGMRLRRERGDMVFDRRSSDWT